MASDAPIRGLWREPGSARAAAAVLRRDEQDTVEVIEADSGRHLALAPLQSLRISARVGSIPRHAEFPGGGDFETADNDSMDRLARRQKRLAGLIHGLEAFRPRLLLFVAAAVALSFAIYRYAVPLLVEVAVAVTPPAVTTLMSAGVLASLDRTFFEASELPIERRAAIAAGFEELTALAGETEGGGSPDAYALNFRKGGPVGPNAFALPDGNIVLTDELVDLAGNDDVVLAVLAHEIGHVEHAHSLRQLYRAAGVAALIMLIAGDVGAATEDVLVQGSALVGLSHSRDAEREADRASVALMHRAGRDPAALVRFFEIIVERFGDTGRSDFLSTHPATPERIEEIRRHAAGISAGAPVQSAD